MGLRNFLSKVFKRARVETNVHSWWAPESASGKIVTADTAMRVAAVYACVKILSESVATLPLVMYKLGSDDSRKRASNHPLYFILKSKPNKFQTSYEWREMMTAHRLLRGNSYSQIQYDNSGRIEALMPMHPDRTKPILTDAGELVYRYQPKGGKEVMLLQDEVLHLKGLSTDSPIEGMSPIEYARETFGRALAEDEYAAKYFANGSRPSGVIEHPGELGEEGLKNFRKEWEQMHSGTANAFKVAILEEGMKWQQMQINNNDSQYIQQCTRTLRDVCRIFGVPPHLIGDMERATFTNIEEKGLDYLQYTLDPLLENFEQRLESSLLLEREQGRYYFEFLVDKLQRGDFKTRMEGYQIGRLNGWLSPNDVRRMENMNPVENGDTYMVPMNYVPLDMFHAVAAANAAAKGKAGAQSQKPGDPAGAGGDKKDSQEG